MMNKNVKRVLLTSAFALGITPILSHDNLISSVSAGNDYYENQLIVNGHNDGDPYFYNKQWYIPLEDIVEGLGGRYQFNNRTNTAIATLYGKKITIKQNATSANIGGKSVSIGAKAVCLDDGYLDRSRDADDLYVPTKFVKNGFKANVSIKKSTARTIITVTKNNRIL